MRYRLWTETLELLSRHREASGESVLLNANGNPLVVRELKPDGFCALRLEPIWTSLGQAAGFAAHVALNENLHVQRVPVEAVQHLVHEQGAATIYVSDVPPDSDDFAAVQWWGTQGGLHGLEPAPKTPGERGELITSQYYEAYPGHAANLGQPLTAELRKAWVRLAKSLGLQVEDLENVQTRGNFIRQTYALYHTRNATKVGVVGEGLPLKHSTVSSSNSTSSSQTRSEHFTNGGMVKAGIPLIPSYLT